MCCLRAWFCFFKQKSAYEMRISDWSSDVCSSDLPAARARRKHCAPPAPATAAAAPPPRAVPAPAAAGVTKSTKTQPGSTRLPASAWPRRRTCASRSEEHTSELQSLMSTSYAVFCLKQKQKTTQNEPTEKATIAIEH